MSEELNNPRWEKFAYYYSIHGNGTRAAREAGYAKKSAHVQANRLLKNDKIQERIRAYHRSRHMDADTTLAALADVARVDLNDYLTINPRGVPRINLRKAHRDQKLGLLREVTFKQIDSGDDDHIAAYDVKLKLHDRLRALEILARHHGLLKDTQININIMVHIELVDRTWQALEEAGFDPVKTFEGLIQIAHERKLAGIGDRTPGD